MLSALKLLKSLFTGATNEHNESISENKTDNNSFSVINSSEIDNEQTDQLHSNIILTETDNKLKIENKLIDQLHSDIILTDSTEFNTTLNNQTQELNSTINNLITNNSIINNNNKEHHVDNYDIIKQYSGKQLTYTEFMDEAQMRGKTFIKFINSNNNHFGFKYNIGLNIDIKQFDPTGSCTSGGLYFTEIKYAFKWMTYGTNIALIELCPDAIFYIDSCLTKFKTNKFIIKSSVCMNLSHLYLYDLFTINYALLYNWKSFTEIRYDDNLINELKNNNINNNPRNPTIEEMKYNDAIVNNNHFYLDDMNKLIKNSFDMTYENDQIKELFDFVKMNNSLCIAGGYMAIQYHERNLKEFESSDIDVYIFKNNNLKDMMLLLLTFIDDKFGIQSITSYNKKDTLINISAASAASTGVFNIKCNNLNRVIQIICTRYYNLAELLSDYDTGYCKVGYYQGNTYVSPDAKFTKDTNLVYIYRKYLRMKRLEKINKFKFHILNKHILNKINIYEENNYKQNPITYEITLEEVYNNCVPIDIWTGY